MGRAQAASRIAKNSGWSVGSLFSAEGGTLRFHRARFGEIDFTAVQRAIRHRVLRAAKRHGCLTPDAIADLEGWEHGGGFSVHAGVLVEAEDRAALERLLRCCARPAFASERLEWECDSASVSGSTRGADSTPASSPASVLRGVCAARGAVPPHSGPG